MADAPPSPPLVSTCPHVVQRNGTRLLDRIDAVAAAAGDEYHLAGSRVFIAEAWRGNDWSLISPANEATTTCGCARPSLLRRHLPRTIPPPPRSSSPPPRRSIEASGNRDLRERMLGVRAMAARCTGDLRRCLELGRQVIDNPASANSWVLSPMSFAALLARDARRTATCRRMRSIEQGQSPRLCRGGLMRRSTGSVYSKVSPAK